MREPRNYQPLKDAAPEAGRDVAPEDDGRSREPAASTDQAPKADKAPTKEVISSEQVEAALDKFNENLALRVKYGRITAAERTNLRGRWENDVLRGDPVDQVTARYDGSRPENSPRPARAEAQERPKTGANPTNENQAVTAQAVTPGKETTELMQTRLDRLHAAQSNAPKGWDRPLQPNSNGASRRGGGARGR